MFHVKCKQISQSISVIKDVYQLQFREKREENIASKCILKDSNQ